VGGRTDDAWRLFDGITVANTADNDDNDDDNDDDAAVGGRGGGGWEERRVDAEDMNAANTRLVRVAREYSDFTVLSGPGASWLRLFHEFIHSSTTPPPAAAAAGTAAGGSSGAVLGRGGQVDPVVALDKDVEVEAAIHLQVARTGKRAVAWRGPNGALFGGARMHSPGGVGDMGGGMDGLRDGGTRGGLPAVSTLVVPVQSPVLEGGSWGQGERVAFGTLSVQFGPIDGAAGAASVDVLERWLAALGTACGKVLWEVRESREFEMYVQGEERERRERRWAREEIKG
jgi:hypothetical protein